MDKKDFESLVDLKYELETDIRRAILGSNALGNPMLTYFLRMAVEELTKTEKSFDAYLEPQTA